MRNKGNLFVLVGLVPFTALGGKFSSDSTRYRVVQEILTSPYLSCIRGAFRDHFLLSLDVDREQIHRIFRRSRV